MATFRAHLSRNEETTLRRVAIGTLGMSDVRVADAKRLVTLELVEVADGLLIPTSRGFERLRIEERSPAKPQGQRRLKARRLPF
jgi:hypothetical protein